MTWGFSGIYEFELAAVGSGLGTYWAKLVGDDLFGESVRPDAPLRFVVFAEQDQWLKETSGGWRPRLPIQLQLQGHNTWLAGASRDSGPMISEQPVMLYYTSFPPSEQLPVIELWYDEESWPSYLAMGSTNAPGELVIAWLGYDAVWRAALRLHCLVPSIAQIVAVGGCPGADFGTVNLNGADFGGARRASTGSGHSLLDLSKCRFDGCSLRGARLSFVNLSCASLAGADLSGADLSGSILKGADLRGARLAGTDFSNADLTNSKFDADGRPKFSTDPNNPTKFTGATLPFSVIGLDWSYLDLVGADLVGIPVDERGHLALSGLQAVAANLSGRLFSNANLRSSDAVTNFSGATLVGANFSGADCTGANFTGATLGGGPGQAAAVMSTATLFNATFDDAQLSGVNLSGAYLYGAGASVSGATMAGVDFSNAYLTGLDLSNVRNADMAGAIFDRACCVNCNFRGTTVMPDSTGRGGSFVAACLQGADFTDSTLGGADLVNAGCAPACPTPGTCTFPATLTIAGSPVTIQITLNNAGTVLPASATTSAAVCPDKSFGPCTGAQLYAADAPKAWPVATKEKV